MNTMKFEELEQIMARLRAEDGCPWDIKQTHETLKPYLLEEAAEVLDAIDEGDMNALKEELGDVLLQVVFHSQIACEHGHFDLSDVADILNQKLVRRHPHVFADVVALSAEGVVQQWEEIKLEEKGSLGPKSVLDTVPKHLSALHRADKMLGKMGKSGVDAKGFLADEQEISDTFAQLLMDKSAELSDFQLQRMLLGLVRCMRGRGYDAETLLRSEIRAVSARFMELEGKACE